MPRRPLRPARIAGGLGARRARGRRRRERWEIAFASVAVARTVVTPPSRRTDDVRILEVDLRGGRIVLQPTADSLVARRLQLLVRRRPRACARRRDRRPRRRPGHPRAAQGRLRRPGERPARSVQRLVLVEPARPRVPVRERRRADAARRRAGLVDPRGGAPSTRWVIQVHGRAVRRSETLRAVAPFRDAGYTSLLVSYRNDGDAPRSADFRYALGDREWLDVEAAIAFARDHGATDIVLMGWSMGGATVLQALTRSPLSDVVRGVVLESPVVDWVATLDFQARLRRVPPLVRAGVLTLLKSRWAGLFTGLAEPLDFDRLDFVRRADRAGPPHPAAAQRRRRLRAGDRVAGPRRRASGHRDLRAVRGRPAHEALELRPRPLGGRDPATGSTPLAERARVARVLEALETVGNQRA